MVSIAFIALMMQGDWSQKWEITFENRAFPNDDLQQTQDFNSGLFGRGEVSWKKGKWKFLLRGFGRLDMTVALSTHEQLPVCPFLDVIGSLNISQRHQASSKGNDKCSTIIMPPACAKV